VGRNRARSVTRSYLRVGGVPGGGGGVNALAQPATVLGLGAVGGGTPALNAFGPTAGAQSVRDGAGPQIAVTDPGGGRIGLLPANSFSANQGAINAAGNGAAIWWPAGEYRLAGSEGYVARSGQTWYLQTPPKGTVKNATNTAIIKRSLVVSGWTAGTGADTGLWFATGQTQNFGNSVPVNGTLADAINKLYFTEREDYWLDSDTNVGTVLWPVASKAALLALVGVRNCRWFDEPGDTVWINFNPAGHVIERTVGNDVNASNMGVVSGAQDVTFRGGISEHTFGNPLSMGGSTTGTERNIRAEHMTLRMTHQTVISGWGDFIAPVDNVTNRPTYVMDHCYIGWGGAYGLTFQRPGEVTTQFCEVAYNNWGPSSKYGIDDEGAQKNGNVYTFSKFNFNWVHHNNSSVWWDTNCPNLEIRENVFEDNPMGYAVMLEDVANSTFLVKRNMFKDNGYEHPWFVDDQGWSVYHINTGGGPGYQTNIGQMNLQAANNGVITENWFRTLATDPNKSNGQEDIEIGWQLRSTGNGCQNVSIHHNRFDRTLRMPGTGFFPYRGFFTSDTASACHPHAAADNNKWDFNEYHVPVGTAGLTDWFNRGGTSHLTFAQWKAGFTGCVGGAPASYYDPNSTLTADL
jgi:hypothetical protein